MLFERLPAACKAATNCPVLDDKPAYILSVCQVKEAHLPQRSSPVRGSKRQRIAGQKPPAPCSTCSSKDQSQSCVSFLLLTLGNCLLQLTGSQRSHMLAKGTQGTHLWRMTRALLRSGSICRQPNLASAFTAAIHSCARSSCASRVPHSSLKHSRCWLLMVAHSCGPLLRQQEADTASAAWFSCRLMQAPEPAGSVVPIMQCHSL